MRRARTDDRRGFTLLEMLFAATLGGLVIAGSAAVLGLLSRSEQTLSRRHIHVSQMGTLHNLLQDAFGTLIMSNTPQPDDAPDDTRGDADDGSEAGDTGGDVSAGTDEPDAAELNALTERPRMILRIDPNLGSYLETIDPSRGVPDTTGGVQSFELVTGSPPGGYDLPARLTSEERAFVRATRLAARGVFELRPDRQDPTAWALWWRPVQSDGETFYDAFETDREKQAILLLQGIERMRWQVYDDEQRKPEFDATWTDQLPAYVEVEIAMTSGLYANWMFEIGWTNAAEQVVTGVVEDEDNGSGELGGGNANPGANPAAGGGGNPRGGDGGFGGGRDRRGVPGRSGERPASAPGRGGDRSGPPNRSGGGGGGGR